MCAMVLLAGVEESCRFDAASGDRVQTLTLPMFARYSPVVKTARNHFGLFAKKMRFCSQNKEKLIRLLLPGVEQIYEFTGCRRARLSPRYLLGKPGKCFTSDGVTDVPSSPQVCASNWSESCRISSRWSARFS
jgi:hypothetical protein